MQSPGTKSRTRSHPPLLEPSFPLWNCHSFIEAPLIELPSEVRADPRLDEEGQMKQVRAARPRTRQILLMQGSQEAPRARESRTSQIHLDTTAASCCTKTVVQIERAHSESQTDDSKHIVAWQLEHCSTRRKACGWQGELAIEPSEPWPAPWTTSTLPRVDSLAS